MLNNILDELKYINWAHLFLIAWIGFMGLIAVCINIAL